MATASQSRSLSDENPVGAWLAREECTAVFQVLRVIVLRGQAALPQVMRLDLPALGAVYFCSLWGVTRNTSSIVVKPAATFCAPDKRKLRMPSLKA
ncbi:hypothetical protein PMI18_02432 [Pseudomonas sp. GM102]|nr:hypothetical protein PMI18_02432 [Pseudomonas sp. GM102]